MSDKPNQHDLTVLSLENLCRVHDGRLAGAFDREVGRAIGDCADRPMLKRAREITLKVKINPTAVSVGKDERGRPIYELDGAKVDTVVQPVKLPDVAPPECDMGVRQQGDDRALKLIFSPKNPANHLQAMLEFGDEE